MMVFDRVPIHADAAHGLVALEGDTVRRVVVARVATESGWEVSGEKFGNLISQFVGELRRLGET